MSGFRAESERIPSAYTDLRYVTPRHDTFPRGTKSKSLRYVTPEPRHDWTW